MQIEAKHGADAPGEAEAGASRPEGHGLGVTGGAGVVTTAAKLMEDLPARVMAELAAGDYAAAGHALGLMVAGKRADYGCALERAAEALALFYPSGIRPEQYLEAFVVFRVLEKLSRIAAGDRGGESGWLDIAGHALVELQRQAEEASW